MRLVRLAVGAESWTELPGTPGMIVLDVAQSIIEYLYP